MDYENFKEYIEENFSGTLVDVAMAKNIEAGKPVDDEAVEKLKNARIKISCVLKNNGVKFDALTVYEQGRKDSPNIYIKPYFYSYLIGKPLNYVMIELAYKYFECPDGRDLEICDLNDFETVKDKIIVRAVNREMNSELLQDCPHKDFLDLAVTFRYIISNDAFGTASLQITDNEFEKWGMDVEELFKVALSNTERISPWQIIPISKVVEQCLEGHLNELPAEVMQEIDGINLKNTGVNMFILTNYDKFYGASVMLYKNVIRNFAKVQGANVYILPSSVHETMVILEDEKTDREFLKSLLKEANDSSVGLVDYKAV